MNSEIAASSAHMICGVGVVGGGGSLGWTGVSVHAAKARSRVASVILIGLVSLIPFWIGSCMVLKHYAVRLPLN